MKKYLAGFLLVGFLTVNAQSISDYKYIIVPEKFSGFDENQYQLNRYLRLQLSKKNYEMLSIEPVNWPLEVRQNPCLALNADVNKIRGFLKNKLEIIFTDCNNKEISRLDGESKIKEYDKGYQDAMKTALNTVKMQNAKPMGQIHQNTELPADIANTTENKIVPTPQKSALNLFSNGEIKLIKTDLADGSFMLINEESSQVFAQFYPSSKQGVFHVKMIHPNGENYYTIGYANGNSISIETQYGSNQWKLTEFEN